MAKLSALDRYFHISEKKSSVKIEIIAGITTFLSMCYILTVNPTQLLLGEKSAMWPSVFLATVFGAVIGTLIMAFYAKMPYAQAPGMGLNALAGAMIGAAMGVTGTALGYNFGTTMLLVLISGVIFLILSVVPCGRDKATGKLVNLREKIFDGVPKGIRLAIPVGIGLFLAFIGMKNASLVGKNEFTLLQLAEFSSWNLTPIMENGSIAGYAAPAASGAVICLFGVIVIAITSHFKLHGSVLIGILSSTVLAIIMQLIFMAAANGLPVSGLVDFGILTGKGGYTWAFWENFSNFFSMDASNGGAFLACFHDIDFSTGTPLFAIMSVLAFCMIEVFDTTGTITGCASKAGMLDREGRPIAYGKCMVADSVATVASAFLGTSPVTTFVESGTGIAAGGRTGLTALTVAVLFFLSIFLLPLFAFIPSAAAACALVYVGVYMIGQIKLIDFNDIRTAVPAFFTIVIMPFGYSITNGIGMGMLTYVVIALICYGVECTQLALKKAELRAQVESNPTKSYLVRYTRKGVVYRPAELAMPRFPIPLITGIVAVLFIIYFFVPKGG